MDDVLVIFFLLIYQKIILRNVCIILLVRKFPSSIYNHFHYTHDWISTLDSIKGIVNKIR